MVTTTRPVSRRSRGEADAWLTLHDAADALGVHPNTARRWADAAAIRSYRTIGGHRRLSASDVYAMVQPATPISGSTAGVAQIDQRAGDVIEPALRGDLSASEARLQLRALGHAEDAAARRAGLSAAATIASHLSIRQTIRERVSSVRIAAGIARSELDEREWSDPLADAFLLGLAEATGSVPARVRGRERQGDAAAAISRRGPPQ